MKVRAYRPKYSKEFIVELIQGTQGFRLDYRGSRAECRWMARMFRIALKNHDLEVRKRSRGRTRR